MAFYDITEYNDESIEEQRRPPPVRRRRRDPTIPPDPKSLHARLFIDLEQAKTLGTDKFPDPIFDIYESDSLKSVDLCDSVQNKLFPKYLPRPYAINSVQAHAVRLAMVQYYKFRNWRHDMSEKELVTASFNKNERRGGGFIIGDGTGMGKTREMAATLNSIILAEGEVQKCINTSYTDCIPDRDRWTTLCKPFFIWLTCSKNLFVDCQEDTLNVITNPRDESWATKGFKDAPCYYNIFDTNLGGSGSLNNSYGISTTNQDGEPIRLRLINMQDLKTHMAEKDDVSKVVKYMTLSPTILFMTYSDLMCNLPLFLKFLFGDLNDCFTQPDPFVTAILCDEFHTPNNISDTMRGFLDKVWEEEDKSREAGNNHPRSSVTNTIMRLKEAFDAKKSKRYNDTLERKATANPRTSTLEIFLSMLSRADSFRLLLELTKKDTFFLMASATPFQSNDDLHSIDHILRCVVPTYTSTCMALKGAGKSNPDRIADASEYATLFLEDVVRMLGNRGFFVSRSISLKGVESAVVSCAITPLQRFALDEISAFFMEMKRLLGESASLGKALKSFLSSIPGHVSAETVEAVIGQINDGNVIGYGLLERIDHRTKIVIIKPTDSTNELSMNDIIDNLVFADIALPFSANGKQKRQKKRTIAKKSTRVIKRASPTDEEEHEEGGVDFNAAEEEYEEMEEDLPETVSKIGEKLVDRLLTEAGLKTLAVTETNNNASTVEPICRSVIEPSGLAKRLTQYRASVACKAVNTCKSALLAVKARSVAKCLKKTQGSKKFVMSLEETGDSFLTDLASRIVHGGDKTKRKKNEKKYAIFDMNPYESSPLATTVMRCYNEVALAIILSTIVRVRVSSGEGEDDYLYVMLVPRPPPPEPLMVMSGNSIDIISQCVGETKYAEITNRKVVSRITDNGLMLLRNNSKTSNTNKGIDSFNNSKEVDVMILGPKGSTGLSLHDSKKNKVNARRVHFIIDLPYNAISYRQTIGRTHRNGQLTSPIYAILSSDTPAEKRFFDVLEDRVKNSKAGSFGNRHCDDTAVGVGFASSMEQFLDKQLILKTMGMVIKMLSGDMNQLDIFIALSKSAIQMKENYYSFVEGLDVTNGYFLNIVLLGLHMSLVLIGESEFIADKEDRERAEMLTGALADSVSVTNSIAGALSVYLSSDLCLKHSGIKTSVLVDYFNKENENPLCAYETSMLNMMNKKASTDAAHDTVTPFPELLEKISKAANTLIKMVLYNNRNDEPEESKNPLFDIEDDDNEDKESFRERFNRQEFLKRVFRGILKCTFVPNEVVTVRILGGGSRQGVVSHNDIYGLIVNENMISAASTVAATSVITSLCREEPTLIFNLQMSANLLKQFTFPYAYSSYSHRLSKRLADKMTYRQFQNEYFSTQKESELMRDLFLSTRAVMARDDRLEGLCRNRKVVMMDASYETVRIPPTLPKGNEAIRSKRILDYVEEEDEEEENDMDTALGGDNNNDKAKDYDLDIVLMTGEKVTLTLQNSIFASEHIDFFVFAHMFDVSSDFMQIRFSNAKLYGLPYYCLYNPNKNSV